MEQIENIEVLFLKLLFQVYMCVLVPGVFLKVDGSEKKLHSHCNLEEPIPIPNSTHFDLVGHRSVL